MGGARQGNDEGCVRNSRADVVAEKGGQATQGDVLGGSCSATETSRNAPLLSTSSKLRETSRAFLPSDISAASTPLSFFLSKMLSTCSHQCSVAMSVSASSDEGSMVSFGATENAPQFDVTLVDDSILSLPRYSSHSFRLLRRNGRRRARKERWDLKRISRWESYPGRGSQQHNQSHINAQCQDQPPLIPRHNFQDQHPLIQQRYSSEGVGSDPVLEELQLLRFRNRCHPPPLKSVDDGAKVYSTEGRSIADPSDDPAQCHQENSEPAVTILEADNAAPNYNWPFSLSPRFTRSKEELAALSRIHCSSRRHRAPRRPSRQDSLENVFRAIKKLAVEDDIASSVDEEPVILA